MFDESTQDTQPHITVEHLLFALVMALALMLRIGNLDFNTLYLDEAIYVTVGEDVLAGVLNQGAPGWMFGSYLYPVLAALTSSLGGVVALRILSALLTLVAAVFVYAAARRIFGVQTALWALLIFSLSGVSISLGQHAVYDALGVPLMAAALYFLVRGVHDSSDNHMAWAGVMFSLSVLAKYIGLLLLPALIVVALAFHLALGRGLGAFFTRVPWRSFFLPVLIILGIYAALYHQDLGQVFSGQFASQSEDRGIILGTILSEIGIPLALALVGVLLSARDWLVELRGKRGLRTLLLLSLPLLVGALLTLPLYHLLTANVRSLWKHNVYALVFLAPFAGYGVARLSHLLTGAFQEQGRWLRFLGAGLTAVAVFAFVAAGIQQNAGFQHSWPNAAASIDYLKSLNITPQSRILSPSYAILEYYFDFGVEDRPVWSNVWYTEYDGLMGTDAITKAIEDCYFDVAVMDSYYAPEWVGTLEVLLGRAGYVIAHSAREQLSTGVNMVTNVHVAPETCRRQTNAQ